MNSRSRTSDILAWVALAFAFASLALRLGGVSAVEGAEARVREVLTPIGMITLAGGILFRSQYRTLSTILLAISDVALVVTVILLLRGLFAG
jgi:hypothetical protein